MGRHTSEAPLTTPQRQEEAYYMQQHGEYLLNQMAILQKRCSAYERVLQAAKDEVGKEVGKAPALDTHSVDIAWFLGARDMKERVYKAMALAEVEALDQFSQEEREFLIFHTHEGSDSLIDAMVEAEL